MKSLICRAATVAVVLGFLASGWAQTTDSIIEGRVLDSSAAGVPGAAIEVKGETVVRIVSSDASGFYRAVALPAGSYKVTASANGFALVVFDNVVLTLDRTATLNISLAVAARRETVTVNETVPLIDSTDSSTKQLIDSRTIDAIPLDGRNYLDLLLLQPGIVANGNARTDLSSRDSNGAILGERAGNTSYLLNGQDNNDDFHGGVLQAFTQDAIKEFEVIEAGYKAEFGRGSAGVVNVITKSGTNTPHGSAFLFLRNDSLDSSNVTGQPAPQLARYDYGGTYGGPLRKDKSWFFGSVEHVAEKRGNIYAPNIPAVLSAGEDFSRQPVNDNTRIFGKYTQQLNAANQLHGELSWTRANDLNELSSAISLPSASNNNLTNTLFGTVGVTTVFSPHVLLDSAFSVRSQNFSQNLQGSTNAGGYEILFTDDGTSFNFGFPPGSVQTLQQRYYTGRETLSFFASERHSLKFGVDFERTTADGMNGQDLQNVILTSHANFAQFGTASFQIPQGVAFVNPGDNLTKIRNNGVGFFGQDDWKISKSLTLNIGARYDYDSVFARGNIAPRAGLTWSPDQKTVVQASFGMFYDRYRLGIAQAVPAFGGFNGQTIVEVDFPRLADDAYSKLKGTLGATAKTIGDPLFLNKKFNIPTGALVTIGNVQSLTGMTPAQFTAAVNAYVKTITPTALPVDFSPTSGYLRQNESAAFQDAIQVASPFRTPYNNTTTVGVQRQLFGDLMVGATYVHRSIRDILGVRIPNLAFDSRTLGQAVTTDGGPLQRTYGPWYDGKYDGLIVKVDKQFGHHFQLRASYTFANSTDDLLNSNLGLGVASQGGGAVPTDNLNVEFDRGHSDLFVPQGFVAYGLVTLPWRFDVSGVLRSTSGAYFTAAGTPIDYDGDGISSLRPPGTTRNQFRGPATNNVDLRIQKKFSLGERCRVSGLIEFFNLTNARNPSVVDNSFVNGVPGPTFGQVRIPQFGREIQLGTRFEF